MPAVGCGARTSSAPTWTTDRGLSLVGVGAHLAELPIGVVMAEVTVVTDHQDRPVFITTGGPDRAGFVRAGQIAARYRAAGLTAKVVPYAELNPSNVTVDAYIQEALRLQRV